MEKLVEGSCEDKHGGKNDSRTSPGDQMTKLRSASGTKRKTRQDSSISPKVTPVYNLRSKDPKMEGVKDSPAYNLRSKRKTEAQNTSKIVQKKKTPKKEGSKDSLVAIQRRVIPETKHFPKISALPVKNIGTTMPLNTPLTAHVKKSQPSSSQFEPFFHHPIYHIKWEGYELGSGPCGQICVLCNKDLSSAFESSDDEDDDSEYNDGYEDDEEDAHNAYFDERAPPILPLVDVLECGHAYHTHCLQPGAHELHSGDHPLFCVLCSRMA